MIKSINLNLNKDSYKILIKQKIFKDVLKYHLLKNKNAKAIVITDKNVAKIYKNSFVKLFESNNIKVQTIILRPGEISKDLSVINTVSEKILSKGLKRSDVVYALGGGVVGDFSGFLASVLLRGIKYVQIPTTLLSQVDSSVGGKTAVNSVSGKNLIGSFYQPSAVFIDPNTLKTLTIKEFLSGYSEVLKYSLIADKNFFNWLDNNYKKIMSRNSNIMIELINKCCVKKAKIVKKDEKEKNHRMLLNLGHTFAHAIEKELKYKVRHGDAVAVGLLMASKLSISLGENSLKNHSLIFNHLEKFKLPTNLKSLNSKIKWNSKNLLRNMLSDKKRSDDKIRFILLKDIGKAFIKNGISNHNIFFTLQEFVNA